MSNVSNVLLAIVLLAIIYVLAERWWRENWWTKLLWAAGTLVIMLTTVDTTSSSRNSRIFIRGEPGHGQDEPEDEPDGNGNIPEEYAVIRVKPRQAPAGPQVLNQVCQGPECPQIIAADVNGVHNVWLQHHQLSGVTLQAPTVDALIEQLDPDCTWDIYKWPSKYATWHAVNMTLPGQGIFKHPLSVAGKNVLMYNKRWGSGATHPELDKWAAELQRWVRM